MTTDQMPPCPVCRRPAVTPLLPFCSRRCADADLGRWLSGQYVLPSPATDADDPDPPG